MRILSAEEVDAALDDLALIDRLEAAFRDGTEVPVRHHHHLPTGTLLLMPAWTSQHLGIKLVTVFPDNVTRALPSVFGQYVLLDGRTGQSLALLDGTMLTKRRTACASGLAALSRAAQRCAAADDRHRRSGAASGAGARQGAADPRGRDLGPPPGPG